MEKELVKKYIKQLDGMIVTISHIGIVSGLTEKERKAHEALKDARLKLMEVLED